MKGNAEGQVKRSPNSRRGLIFVVQGIDKWLWFVEAHSQATK
jgi:hypothetical protein